MEQYNFSEQGVELEHLAWNIIQNKQRRHGFPFNKQKAEVLYAELRQREDGLRQEIHSLWPPELCPVGEFQRAFKNDGQPTSFYQRHLEQYPKLELLEGGGYRAYDYVEFNIGSPKQRISKLLELGWTPVQKTPNGNPKIDEDSLLAFAETSGIKEVQAIAKWLVVNSRANMVRTWLNAYNEETGAIHGKLFIASTLRYRHSSPNSANVPAVKSEKVDGKEIVLKGEKGTWAYECRDLFDCGDPKRYSLVGVDAKGIQIRVLLNYAYSKEAVDLYLEGDPHVNNAALLGLANKPAAKKFFYTLIMGGQGARLATDQLQFGTKLTPAQGSAMRDQMIATIPGFADLITNLQRELERTGRIKLCDGTPILVPSPHMVIPYLLQGDESRIMKQAMIYADQEIRRARLDKYVFKVADIHDEWQHKVLNEAIEEYKYLTLPCFPRAGEKFNYRVPIEGDAKEGLTWAETH
jgi:DNA polymerase I-like protein with 3'-5' exonuclease and polymerase domains